MSDRPDDLLVDDVWESLGRIREYVEGIAEDGFAADNKTVDAVVRNLSPLIVVRFNRCPRIGPARLFQQATL